MRRPAGRQPGSIHAVGSAGRNHANDSAADAYANSAALANCRPNANFHAAAQANHRSNANAGPYCYPNGCSNRNPLTYPAARCAAGSHRSSRLYR